MLMLAGADTAEAHAVKLDFLQVTTGKGVKSVASIGLDISNQKFEAAASGNGPVDAAIKALKKIIMKQMTLKEFTIQAISKGCGLVVVGGGCGVGTDAGGFCGRRVLWLRWQFRYRNRFG